MGNSISMKFQTGYLFFQIIQPRHMRTHIPNHILALAFMLFLATAAFASSPLPATETLCPPPASAWEENITPNHFDAFWDAVPGAIGYRVEVQVNGLLVAVLATPAPFAHISLPIALVAGDEVVYDIYSICEMETSGEFLRRTFNIIATVDVVMGLEAGSINCEACPVLAVQSTNSMYKLYDCLCVRSKGLSRECETNQVALGVAPCISTPKLQTQPLFGASVFPNPFEEVLTWQIDLQSAQTVTIQLLDATGREVFRTAGQTYDAGMANIACQLPPLRSGIYVFQLIAGDRLLTGKAVRR